MRNAALLVLISWVLWLMPNAADAQLLVSYDVDELIPLSIQINDPTLSVSIQAIGTQPQPLKCTGLCRGQLPRGRYRLTLHEHGTGDTDSMVIRLRRPTHFVTDRPSTAARYGGMALLITGGAAVVTGVAALVLTVLGIATCGAVTVGHGDCGNSQTPVLIYAGVATPLGVAAAIVGLTLYKRNRHAFKPVELDVTPTSVSLVPTLGGASAIVTKRF